jgi:glycosidase
MGAKMLLGLLFSLRGTTYIYQGQEIGMTNGAFSSLDEIMDIESHNVDKMAKKLGIINPFRWKLIRTTSRDNARTPMQWSAEENAGFTSGKPWLKLHPNYTEINVERDLASEDGIISFFKEINDFKNSSEIIKEGSFKEVHRGKWVYVFERMLDGKKLTVICNFKDKALAYPVLVEGERILSNYKDESKKLRPYEFVIIENK